MALYLGVNHGVAAVLPDLLDGAHEPPRARPVVVVPAPPRGRRRIPDRGENRMEKWGIVEHT